MNPKSSFMAKAAVVVGLIFGAAWIVSATRNAHVLAGEDVLRAQLAMIRRALHHFQTDKKRPPSSLDELVKERYIRQLPRDPITRSSSSWHVVVNGSAIVDVRSGAS